jgi:hypothetical protein
MWMARLYLWGWLPGGKRARIYSINVMRARHPGWFREDLERLFRLLATRAIRPRVVERISFDEVPRHTAVSRRAVSRASSSCAQTSRRDATGCRLSASGTLPPSCSRTFCTRLMLRCIEFPAGLRRPGRSTAGRQSRLNG